MASTVTRGTVTSTREGMFSNQLHAFNTRLQHYDQSSQVSKLSTHVRDMFAEAVRHKREINATEEIELSYHASVSRYTPEQLAMLPKNGTDIFMGITENKCRAFVSWIADILSGAEERPWTLAPTPVSDIPAAMKEAVVNVLRQEIANNGIDFDVEARIRDLKQFAFKHAQARANEAARLHEQKIHDQMEEGGWREAFDGFIEDLAWAPTAFLKAPVMKNEKKLRWRNGTLYETYRPCLCIERVDPRNVYPSADSTTTQDGSYIFELKQMHPHQLKESTTVPGFQATAIEHILASHDQGFDDWVARCTSSTAPGIKKKETDYKAPMYDVAVMYGRLPGDMLLNFALPVDPQSYYEAEVWIIDDVVIRAILNPHPLGKRPLEGCSFAPRPGSFWGRGIPLILKDIQRVANAAARALVVNMGYSSGPITEYDQDRLINETEVDEIHPYRVYAVETDPSGGGSSAFRFSKIQSYATEFQGVYDRFSREADDISGIPAYVIGSPQVAGAGRTLGGLSLLMGNAAKGIKRNLSTIDKRVIEPVVEKYYTLNLIYDDDMSIKADAQVMARGSAGLLQRELSQARTVEVLSVLTPFIQAGFIQTPGVMILLRQIINGLGYDADSIIDDPQRRDQIIQAVQQAQTTGSNAQPSINPPSAIPQLDGRSAQALPAIDALTPVPSPTGLPQGA